MEDSQKLAYRNAEIGVINEIAAAVNAEHDFRKIFEVFARQLDRLIAFEATSLLVLDEDGNLFTGWIIERGEEGGLISTELAYPPRHYKDKPSTRNSASSYVLVHGEPVIREDWSKPGRFPLDSNAAARGIRSDVLFPLRFRDEVIGVLTLTSKTPNAFSETDFPLLLQLAEQLGPALSNARLLRVLEAANKEIGILNEIATAVNSERDSQQIFEVYVHQVGRLLDLSATSLSVIGNDGRPRVKVGWLNDERVVHQSVPWSFHQVTTKSTLIMSTALRTTFSLTTNRSFAGTGKIRVHS